MSKVSKRTTDGDKTTMTTITTAPGGTNLHSSKEKEKEEVEREREKENEPGKAIARLVVRQMGPLEIFMDFQWAPVFSSSELQIIRTSVDGWLASLTLLVHWNQTGARDVYERRLNGMDVADNQTD